MLTFLKSSWYPSRVGAPARREPPVIFAGMSRRHEVFGIILVGVLVRLVGFTAPYTSQHWIKQLQIAPIAKNFYQKSPNILWPETDYSADKPGYIEIEFQLVTWLTALLYHVFGIHEWVGRLVTIAFSTGSMVLLYRLMLIVLGPAPAAYGLLFFAFAPSNWYFSRVLMSEPAMLFFSIALVYSFSLWLSSRSRKHYVWAILCGALCFLVKLPTVLLVIPLLYLARQRFGPRVLRRRRLWLLAALTLLPAAAYYTFANQVIGKHYFTVGVDFGGAMWFSLGNFLRPGNWSLMALRFVKEHLTAIGVTLLPLGFLATTDSRLKLNVFHYWLGAGALYLIVVSGGNIRQNYYQLHLIPPAAALIGLGWERIASSHRFSPYTNLVMVALFLGLAAWGVQPMFELYQPIHAAAAELNELDPGRSPVIIYPAGYGCLYYFDRPGWVGREGMGKPAAAVAPEDQPDSPDYVDSRIARGARWLVSFTPDGQEFKPALHQYFQSRFRSVARCGDYEIFDLLHRPSGQPASSAPGLPARGPAQAP